VDDFATALVRLSQGATVALESTWACFSRPGLSVTVFGTQGGAILDLTQPAGKRLTLFTQEDNTLLESVPVEISLPMPVEATVLEHFANCVRSGRTPENSAERGIGVMQVLEAIYESSNLGRDVVLGS
jgi:predicted dehydrogenase